MGIDKSIFRPRPIKMVRDDTVQYTCGKECGYNDCPYNIKNIPITGSIDNYKCVSYLRLPGCKLLEDYDNA